ncbi:MAG TPA: site-specific integrase [Beijerinckiaceae bacterium]
MQLREITPEDVQAAVWDHYREELDTLDREHQALPSPGEVTGAKAQLMADLATRAAERKATEHLRDKNGNPIKLDPPKGWAVPPPPPAPGLVALHYTLDYSALAGAREFQEDSRAKRLATLRRHLATGETALVEYAADALIERKGLNVGKGSFAYRDLCTKLMRAEIEALTRGAERAGGDYTGRPRDELVRPPLTVVSSATAAPGEGILELFDTFASQNPKGVTSDTLRMNRKIIELFADFAGARTPAASITPKLVGKWIDALHTFPIKAAEVRDFRDLSFREIIEANKRVGKPVLSPKTINKYLSALGAFCLWLKKRGVLERNPVEDQYLSIDKDVQRVRSYTSEELRRIFAAPLFTGAESEDRLDRPGEHRVRDHRFWLPLMSLFSGARMGELAQLSVADVRQQHGHWVMRITREYEDGKATKTTKTKASQRVIPVHPELIRLGFLDYHARQVEAGSSRLFPEIKPDVRGQIAGHFSRFYGRYLAKIGVKDDRMVNFHSFRHSFVDALRRAGYRDEEFGFLLGHTQATTTGRYGNLAEGELAQRVKLIEVVTYPALDLTKIDAST